MKGGFKIVQRIFCKCCVGTVQFPFDLYPVVSFVFCVRNNVFLTFFHCTLSSSGAGADAIRDARGNGVVILRCDNLRRQSFRWSHSLRFRGPRGKGFDGFGLCLWLCWCTGRLRFWLGCTGRLWFGFTWRFGFGFRCTGRLWFGFAGRLRLRFTGGLWFWFGFTGGFWCNTAGGLWKRFKAWFMQNWEVPAFSCQLLRTPSEANPRRSVDDKCNFDLLLFLQDSPMNFEFRRERFCGVQRHVEVCWFNCRLWEHKKCFVENNLNWTQIMFNLLLLQAGPNQPKLQ